jgi:serine/threonine protein kinase
VDPQTAAAPLRSTGPGGEVGPYRLLRLLGRGGMAEVYLAVHRHLGHVRALKVLWPESSRERAALAKRLLTEARATSRLHHPAIVEVFDCDTLEGGGAFIAMEFLQGEPAGAWLARTGPLATHARLAAALVGVVADALGHAHAQGIIHRDVKPDNLVLVPDPEDRPQFLVKVLDFGIAKMLNEVPLVVTRGDRAIGTPCYMAPEQWFGKGPADARTDIYSLGCVFFELLTGRPPFERDDGAAMMHAHLEETPPLLRTLQPDVPETLETLVASMLAKAPDDRPQAMSDVVTVIEMYLDCRRETFEERLRAPTDFPVGHGPMGQGTPTDLGLSEAIRIPGATTAPQTRFSRKAVRWGAGVALVLALLLGIAAASDLFTTRPQAASPPRPAPPAPVVTPPPAPPAPPVAPPIAPAGVTVEPKPATPPPRPARVRERKTAHPEAPPRNIYRPVGD